jgi:guanylate kinase
MVKPPPLTAEQRSAALLKAKESRARRSALKSDIKNQKISVAGVLDLSKVDSAVAKMRVIELIESIPGVGKVRAQTLITKLEISPSRRIGGLGAHQRLNLIKEFALPVDTSTHGRLVVLSGPGGVGKSSVAKALRKRDEFWVSVSATTRSPRSGEKNGVDYFFYSEEQFDNAIEAHEFLEWAAFAGARYGTPKAPVMQALAAGKNVLLEIDIDGAKQVKAHEPNALLVFLEPPTWEELVARLEGRGTDSEERRAARLALAQEELAQASFFDKVLVNEQVDAVVEHLILLAISQR